MRPGILSTLEFSWDCFRMYLVVYFKGFNFFLFYPIEMRQDWRQEVYVLSRLGRLASTLLWASGYANWNVCPDFFNDQICCIWNFIIKSIFRALAILVSHFCPSIMFLSILLQSCPGAQSMSPQTQPAFPPS